MNILAAIVVWGLAFFILRVTLLNDGQRFVNDAKPSVWIKIPEQQQLIPFFEGRWIKNPKSLIKVILSAVLAIVPAVIAYFLL